MTETSIMIIGSGAQCKYALEIFHQTRRPVAAIFDPIGEKAGQILNTIRIASFDRKNFAEEIKTRKNVAAIICISNNRHKKELFSVTRPLMDIAEAIHPASTIASTASLGAGVIVNANAVIQPYSQVGEGAMIHAGVIVEHDNRIGDFVNLAPGVTLAGGVSIGEGATIYSGTVVAPNISIGANTIVGAGSLVLENLPANVMAFGAPAKVVKELRL